MLAAICATSLTSGMRSRRAISRSWSEAGIAVSPVSSTALVSSSTNSGTLSVRAMMVSIVSGVDGRRRAAPRSLRLGAAQAVEGQAGHMGVCGQRRLAVRPAGQQEEHPGGGAPVQALLDHLERGRVDPVGVLDDHQGGCRAASPSSCWASASRVRALCACGVRSSGP